MEMTDQNPEHVYHGDSTTGFASPAQDYVENTIDLSDTLELRRPGRYLMRVEGDDLVHRNIQHDDILVVDTDARPRTGSLVVACVDEDFLVGEARQTKGDWHLVSVSTGRIICLSEAENASIWGVVMSLVREKT